MDRVELIGNYYITGRAEVNLTLKTVDFPYYAKAMPPTSGDEIAVSRTSSSVPYWPTNAATLDNTTVIVAGKGADLNQQNTIIELWRVTTPAVVFEHNPSTGVNEPRLTGVRVLSRTVVYEAAVVGRDIVRNVVKLRGKPYSVLVQFHDSGDLYELDCTQAVAPTEPPPTPRFPLTKILRATPGTDVPFVVELADPARNWTNGATHVTHGYVYGFWVDLETQLRASGPTGPSLTLFDSDRDGTIDWWGVLSPEQGQAMGLLDDAQYEEQYLGVFKG
jgi:hypothetical protein